MNSDTKRFVLAIALSGFVLLGWQYLFPTQAPTTVTQKSVVKQVTAPIVTATNKIESKEVSSIKVKPLSLTSGESRIVIDNNLNLHDFISPGQMYSFSEIFGASNPYEFFAFIDGAYRPLEFSFTKKSESEVEGISNHGIKFVGKFLPNGRFSTTLFSSTPLRYRFQLRSTEKSIGMNTTRDFIYYTNEADRITVGDDEVVDGEVKWVGVDFNYHIFTAILKDKSSLRITTTEAGVLAADLVQPKTEFSLDYVFVKKNYDDLIALGDKLEMSVDFGFFGIIAVPMLRAMQWLYTFIPNYGISIIILTLLMRLVLYPLQHKSAKSMKKMQKLQPELQKIKEKYKDDQQRIQKETMELFKRGGANPMGGCLPLLLQMPVFFAIYRVLYSAVELVGAPFFGWITDLSAKDPYYVFPVLLTVVMFLQQKMMPTATTDNNQKKIMMAMPLVFGFIMKDMPSGLVLYIFVSTLFAIIQQFLTNKLSD
ncbi:MAG: membrane protein insertase YidC [Bacteriovoracaceae bacterium]|nr:membrane protein insertase YidC [Bacteriovoracaceae bacterium]